MKDKHRKEERKTSSASIALFIFASLSLAIFTNIGANAASAESSIVKTGFASGKSVSSDLLSKVREARSGASLSSTVPEDVLDDHLVRLVDRVTHSYEQSGSLHLLPDVLDASNGAGINSVRLNTLQKTYWLQDNALYGSAALMEFEPAVGKALSESWREKWEQKFPHFCPDTQSDYVVGLLPSYDSPGRPHENRCHLPSPRDWQYFRMHQYPNPQDPGFDSMPTPIIGTDYLADKLGHVELIDIRSTSVRNLLKYGCLRQVLLGNSGLAKQMFDIALVQWDGAGFKNSRNAKPGNAKLERVYWTRDLAFALICANALGLKSDGWSHGVPEAKVEQRLWSSQSSSGGIWTNYCNGANCQSGEHPAIAKQTNEVGPLVLLAYGQNIWGHKK